MNEIKANGEKKNRRRTMKNWKGVTIYFGPYYAHFSDGCAYAVFNVLSDKNCWLFGNHTYMVMIINNQIKICRSYHDDNV